MGVSQFFIIAASSYLLGSLSFAIIICKLTLGKDIRAYGSGNAGLTNAYRTMGAKKTALVLVGDIVKAALALGIAGGMAGMMGKLVAGIFVILGHMFPVYFSFRGGKGVLVGATMLVFLDWRIFLVALALFIASVSATRWISLGSIMGAASFPVSMHVYYGDVRLTIVAFCMAAVVVFMHRANIGRMLHGTENKFSFHSRPQLAQKQDAEEK